MLSAQLGVSCICFFAHLLSFSLSMPCPLVAQSRLQIGLLQRYDVAMMRSKGTTRYAQRFPSNTVHLIDSGILESSRVGDIGSLIFDIDDSAVVELLLRLLLMAQIEHHTAHGHKDDRQRGPAHNARLLEHHTTPGGQIRSIDLLVLATWSHKTNGAFTIIEYLVVYLHGEAGGIVQAIPGGIGGRAGEDRECYIRTLWRLGGNHIIRRRRGRLCLWTGFGYGTRGAGEHASGRAEADAQSAGKQQDTHLETETGLVAASAHGRQTGKQAGKQTDSSGEEYVAECSNLVCVCLFAIWRIY